jgi:MFS family permease
VRGILAKARPGSRLDRGWLIILGAIVMNVLGTGGPFYAAGLLFLPMASEFGWGRGAYSLATSMYLVFMNLSAAPTGYVVDRWGPRRVMLASAVVSCLAWVLVATIGIGGMPAPIWQLCLLYGLLGAASTALASIPVSAILVRSFATDRGTVLGLSNIGASLAGVLLAPVSAAILPSQGWRALAALLAAASVLGCVPTIIWLLGDAAGDTGQPQVAASPGGPSELTLAQAVRTFPFWTIGIALMLGSLGNPAAIVHTIPFLTDHGLSYELASGVLGGLALAGVAGKISLGRGADLSSSKAVAALSMLLQGAALAVLLAWSGIGPAWLYALLFGLGMGGIAAVRPLVIADHFGLRAFASVAGALQLFSVPGMAVGQVLAGYLYDLLGSYNVPYSLFAVAFFLGTGVFLLLGKPVPDRDRSSG